MYGQQPGAYAPPPRRRPGRREPILWLASATLVLIAAIVVIEVVLTSGGGNAEADHSTTPSTPSVSSGTSPSKTGTSPAPTGSAPTTDVLPTNAETSLCDAKVKPEFVAVAVVTVLSGVSSGGTPDDYVKGVLADCTSPAVRRRVSELYGERFGVGYSADLTGGHDAGPTAAYTVENSAGTATLRLQLTEQQDGHYEVTDYTYG